MTLILALLLGCNDAPPPPEGGALATEPPPGTPEAPPPGDPAMAAPAPGTPEAPAPGMPAEPTPGTPAAATPMAAGTTATPATATAATTTATTTTSATPAATGPAPSGPGSAATVTPTATSTDASTPPSEAAAPAAPVNRTYALQPSNSTIYVQVFKDPSTIGAGLSHDHVVVATGWTGSVRWTEGDPTQCSVTLTVPVKSLQNDATTWRKKVGYDNELTDSQRAEVKEHMLGADQLNASKYPDLKFQSTSCAAAGEKVKVNGNLTFHGSTKPVSVTMNVNASATAFSASGSFSLKGSDYGMAPFSAGLGALKNLDQMKFTLDVKGAP